MGGHCPNAKSDSHRFGLLFEQREKIKREGGKQAISVYDITSLFIFLIDCFLDGLLRSSFIFSKHALPIVVRLHRDPFFAISRHYGPDTITNDLVDPDLLLLAPGFDIVFGFIWCLRDSTVREQLEIRIRIIWISDFDDFERFAIVQFSNKILVHHLHFALARRLRLGQCSRRVRTGLP